MKPGHKAISAVVLAGLLGWAAIQIWEHTCRLPGSNPWRITLAISRDVRRALIAYRADFGAYPTGDYAQICRALWKDNPKKKKYVTLLKKDRNPAGEFVDAWSTPLRVNFSEHAQAPRVRSAGKNRVFEEGKSDSDDIFSAM